MRTTFVWLIELCLLGIVTSCAPGNSAFREFVGTWVMKLGSDTFMVITLRSDGQQLKGTVKRPQQFMTTSDGTHFTHITPTVKEWAIAKGAIKDDHLHFVAMNPDDKADNDEYDMGLAGKDQALIKITDAPFEPWHFARSGNADTAVFTAWSQDHSYRLEANVPSNSEMAKIVDEDQKARTGNFFKMSEQERLELSRQDADRRTRTRQLLEGGQLHTGEDFSRAATVFQHGSMPEDYLLAHSLAIVAVSKGDDTALWTSTAALDRYLQSIGRPQIYGTQFKPEGKNGVTQEPYNRELISDAIRLQLGATTLATQQEQLKQYVEQSDAADTLKK
jgi:hypothetical protein